MWGHIFQTLVWFHGNVDQLKSFWWKGGRKVYNNMIASADSPLISCSRLKDKVLLVAVRVVGERPNPTRDPNLMSQPCYGVHERRTDPEKICYELMEHQWKYEGQLENSCYIRLSREDGWTARSLAWNRADGAEEKTLSPVSSTWCRHFKMHFLGLFNVEHRAILAKKSKLLFSQVQNEPKPPFKGVNDTNLLSFPHPQVVPNPTAVIFCRWKQKMNFWRNERDQGTLQNP